LYTNDLPLNVNPVSVPVWFADDTSIIITEPDISHLVESSYYIFTGCNTVWTCT
jgi:hypothetical protein